MTPRVVYQLINLTRFQFDKVGYREECNFIRSSKENTGWQPTDYIIAVPINVKHFIKRFNSPRNIFYHPNLLTQYEINVILVIKKIALIDRLCNDTLSRRQSTN